MTATEKVMMLSSGREDMLMRCVRQALDEEPNHDLAGAIAYRAADLAVSRMAENMVAIRDALNAYPDFAPGSPLS